MKLTHKWVTTQIADYHKLLSTLNDSDPYDLKLKTIWQSSLNTLYSTLHVIELEIHSKRIERSGELDSEVV